MDDDNEFFNDVYVSNAVSSKNTTTVMDQQPTKNTSKVSTNSTEVISLDIIQLNIRLKYNCPELIAFIDELKRPDQHLPLLENGQHPSTLHQYVLVRTHEPIYMSNSNISRYRPDLFTRKTDAFGAWNFQYLLNLLELDYQCHESDRTSFPIAWKTKATTQVIINHEEQRGSNEPSTTDTTEENVNSLEDLLKKICEQNNCKSTEIEIWKKALEGKHT
jgi:hypothetical protein